ncbi:MAG: hypothetical protein DRQ78_12905, partial [Epsilonproteobacteria bacterium]
LQIIEDVNGTDLLFQTESPFIKGTLEVIEKNDPQPDLIRQVVEMGDTYFKIEPAPPVDADLWCYYEQADIKLIGTDELSPWEKANIEKMMSIIAFQQQSITNLEEALSERVTYVDFSKYVEVMERQLKEIQSSLLP